MIDINEIIHEYSTDFSLHIQSLHIPQNSIVGLVGENGAGKTTLMSILAGYLKANKSYNVTTNNAYCKILFIPSDLKLYDFMTVEEFIRLVKKYSDIPFDEAQLLETLELTEKAKCDLDELSLGMKKKLSLLPLFIRKYDVLILDEPFNSVDIGYIYKLKQLLKERKKEVTILLSSHILETLVDLCDSFILISNGTVKKVFENNGDIRQVEGEIFDKST